MTDYHLRRLAVCVRILTVLLLSFLVPAIVHAQNDANNWIFGSHAKLNFGPVPYTGLPQLNTVEGSASISDANGNLLLYTDGVTLWNGNNQQIATGLLGSLSSYATQVALIVPWPQSNCKKYFIFTLQAAFENNPQILSYSVVDMTGNGGAGVVSPQNVQLRIGVAEKLTGISDGAGGFWVAAHGFSTTPSDPINTEYYAYHIDASGIDPNVRISHGAPHVAGSGLVFPAPWASIGQMKFSQDGRQIASAVSSKMVEVLQFSTTSGKAFGTPLIFTCDLGAPHVPFHSSQVYGLEFSPNGKFLYVTTLGEPRTSTLGELFQFDLVSHAGVLVANATASRDMGQLQLAPNGQIYLARFGQSFLSAIRLPDNPHPLPSPGCDFAVNGKNLPLGGVSWLGLPNFIEGPFSCASRSACPPNTTQTTINGTTFCCDTLSDKGQLCCTRLCPVGSTESTVNGKTMCCSTEDGGPIGPNPSRVCCKSP
jgi:WD40 repeat protein